MCFGSESDSPTPGKNQNDQDLFRLPPTFENKDVSVDVLDTDPAGERQWGVGPDPVHHRSQLCQERHQTEPAGNSHILVILLEEGASKNQIQHH